MLLVASVLQRAPASVVPDRAVTAWGSPFSPPAIPLPTGTERAPLFDPSVGLRAPAISVPLRLRIPVIGVNASVSGVGLTSRKVMDTPQGGPTDPVWQEAFWYRGGGIPGDPGTATIAGHYSGGRGPSVFARLHELRPGQWVLVDNTRDGTTEQFQILEVRSYSTANSHDAGVLTRVYGAGPVAGLGPIPAKDGSSWLTLLTCAGDWVRGSYDERLVVFAQSVDA